MNASATFVCSVNVKEQSKRKPAISWMFERGVVFIRRSFCNKDDVDFTRPDKTYVFDPGKTAALVPSCNGRRKLLTVSSAICSRSDRNTELKSRNSSIGSWLNGSPSLHRLPSLSTALFRYGRFPVRRGSPSVSELTSTPSPQTARTPPAYPPPGPAA